MKNLILFCRYSSGMPDQAHTVLTTKLGREFFMGGGSWPPTRGRGVQCR